MTEKPDPVLAASRAFLKRFGEGCGKRLPQVLPEIGLKLHYRPAKTYEGALLRMKGIPRGYVVLSSEVHEVRRQRFTLGHEIGHYLLPDQQDLCQPCGKQQIESWDEALARTSHKASIEIGMGSEADEAESSVQICAKLMFVLAKAGRFDACS